MGFEINDSDIHVDNPRPADEPFVVTYDVRCTTDEGAHHDLVQVWGSDGVESVNGYFDAPACAAGQPYSVDVPVPALGAGHYDIAVAPGAPDVETSAGSTIVVGDPDGAGTGTAGTGAGAATGGQSGDETQEPTLRAGDESPDQWIEYLQQRLMELQIIYSDEVSDGDWVSVTGVYDESTVQAVRWFQRKNGLQVDGVCGNQTWAAVRLEAPQAVGTDGRAPGAHVEHGVEARWETEMSCFYNDSEDNIHALAISVGTQSLTESDFEVEIEVRTPSGSTERPTFEFESHGENIRIRFMAGVMAEHGQGDYEVRLVMSDALGGDILEKPVEVAPL